MTIAVRLRLLVELRFKGFSFIPDGFLFQPYESCQAIKKYRRKQELNSILKFCCKCIGGYFSGRCKAYK